LQSTVDIGLQSLNQVSAKQALVLRALICRRALNAKVSEAFDDAFELSLCLTREIQRVTTAFEWYLLTETVSEIRDQVQCLPLLVQTPLRDRNGR
jgi:hypothetical protein